MVGSVKESASVFVGNLPFEATQEDISGLLSKAGHVVNVKIQTYPNGKPKGWGLVEFSSIAEAKKAIADLNRGEILGRKIHVHNDRSEAEKLEGPSIFVSNLAYTITDESLYEEFAELKPIDAHVKTTRSGKSRGFGIVKFSDADAMNNAVGSFDGKEIAGRTVKVRVDQGREKTESTERRRPQPSNRVRDEEKTDSTTKKSTRGGGRGGRRGGRGRGGEGRGAPRTDRPKREEGERERKPRQPREEPKERAPSTNTEGKRVFIGNLPWQTEEEQLRTFFTPFGNIEEITVAKTETGRAKGWGLVTFDNAETANKAVEKLNKTDFEGRSVYVKVDRK